MSQCNKENKINGFTLVETLVAISIFTIGTLAAAGAVAQSMRLPQRTQDKVIAAHLAQEGIELVRNIRDSNWISSQPWDTNIGTIGLSGVAETGCVEYDAGYVDSNCATLGNGIMPYYLRYDSVNNVFTQNTVYPLTKFARTITITKYDDGGTPPNIVKMLVESDVSCGTTCNVHLQETLFDWQ